MRAGVPIERDEKFRQVERLVSSQPLQSSESLCHILKYLAEQALEHPGQPVKEYQIATEVLGKPADFDPRIDSTVRVQTGRLRSKLAEYYLGPGSKDEVVVDVPKGSYAVIFNRPGVTRNGTAEIPAKAETGKRWSGIGILAGVAAGLLIGALAGARLAVPSKPAPTHPALRQFWQGFLDSPEIPMIVYSNAEFIGRPDSGMRYFDPARDKGKQILDHYTGVGEVLAVHELDRVFSSFGRALRVRRGRLISWDEARNSDVIFIGSPSENLSLRELKSTQRFVFQSVEEGPRKGNVKIVNTRPGPGEPDAFLATAALPIGEDYGIVALVPGLNPARWVMVLAGTTTLGTQAAVEFVCRPAQLTKVLDRLKAGATPPPPFEAVIRTKVSGGVPVQTELVALHRLNLP